MNEKIPLKFRFFFRMVRANEAPLQKTKETDVQQHFMHTYKARNVTERRIQQKREKNEIDWIIVEMQTDRMHSSAEQVTTE